MREDLGLAPLLAGLGEPGRPQSGEVERERGGRRWRPVREAALPLRFHGGQSTLVGCDGPDSLETRFFRALHATRRVAIDADTLALIAADGSRLRFVPATDTAAAAR